MLHIYWFFSHFSYNKYTKKICHKKMPLVEQCWSELFLEEKSLLEPTEDRN